MNHPRLGRIPKFPAGIGGGVGPVIPGAAPMEHIPPFPGGPDEDQTAVVQDQKDHPEPSEPGEPTEPVFHPHIGLDRTRHRPLVANNTDSRPPKPDSEPVHAHEHVSPADVYSTQSILTGRLPPELVDPVLQFAEYFPCQTIGQKSEEEATGHFAAKTYLICHIPDFEAFDDDTEGKGGLEERGRPNRVRKLVFKVSSKDQGWSSFNNGSPEDRGTYKGAYSWLEVELWRKDDSLSNLSNPSGPPEDDDSATVAPNNIVADVHLPSSDDSTTSSISVPHHMVRVGEPQLLQRNSHAYPGYTDHTIVWDWAEDALPDSDPEKWEPGATESWHRGGQIRNGEFIRSLRGGDELRIIMRAAYSGWICRVQRCEVEVYWAV